MKSVVAGVTIVLCGLLCLPAEAIPILSVEPSYTAVQVGDTFSVSIMIRDVEDLFAVDLDVFYDDEIMSLIAYHQGTFLKSEGDSTFVKDPILHPGFLECYAETITGTFDGVTGSGLLLTLDFIAIEEGCGTIEVVGELLCSCLYPIDHIERPAQVIVATPEPATVLLFGVGLALLIRRRK